MRSATVRAAMRRGCVWAIAPRTPRPSSRQTFGICVVLPEPVSPATTTTWWSRMAASRSARRARARGGGGGGDGGLRGVGDGGPRRAPAREAGLGALGLGLELDRGGGAAGAIQPAAQPVL